MADLIVSAEGVPDRVIEVGERVTIGRSPSNELVIDDPKASRHHAEIRPLGGGRYSLMDLGSANGTWLNGRRVTVPMELEAGDTIMIGMLKLRFAAPLAQNPEDPSVMSGTALLLQTVQAVVLVTDIRNFTGMTEALPSEFFSRLIADWFGQSTGIIEKHGGTVDKFIGDAILAYWVSQAQDPGMQAQIREALGTAADLVARARLFSERLFKRFPEHTFRIGVGLNTGEAVFGNVGTASVQSFTLVGDCVNVAFRLEGLSKQLGHEIVVSASLVDGSDGACPFRDLGVTSVKGRKEPVHVFGLMHDERLGG